MLVDYPVHNLEGYKCDWEKNSAIFVNVRSSHTKHLIQFFHVALGVGWGWARWDDIGWTDLWGRHWPRHWHRWQQRWAHGWGSTHVVWVHVGWGCLFVVSTHTGRWASHPEFSTHRAIATNGVFSGAALAMHLGVMHLKVNRL
jgi:hypothetical protein